MDVLEFKEKIHEALNEEMAEMNKTTNSGKPLSNFDQGRCFEIGAVEGIMSKIWADMKKCDTQGEF